jgi:hypothetical protein
MSVPRATTPQPVAGSSRCATDRVGVGERAQRVLGAGRELEHPGFAVGERALDGFEDQLVARAEVLVEAA